MVVVTRQIAARLFHPLVKSSLQRGSHASPQTLQHLKTSTRNIVLSHFVRNKDTHEGIESNPYYSKYEDKIKKALQHREQSSSLSEEDGKRQLKLDPIAEKEIEMFKQKMKKQEEKLKRLGMSEKSSSGEMPLYSQKTLDAIMHMDLLVDKTGEEIGKVWEEYHRQRDCISAVIPATVYEQIEKTSKECPLFLHPLPRDQGYEFMYSEFNGDLCYVTSLINYQAFGSEAPWFLALKHYTELKASKGIVLMVGEIDSQKLDTTEALCIANQIQLYYAGNDENKVHLLRTFNHEPNKFRHTDIVREFERSLFELSK